MVGDERGDMRRKKSALFLVALLLIGMFVLTLSATPTEGSLVPNNNSASSGSGEQVRWNFDEVDMWPASAIVDDNSAELVVGVNELEPAGYARMMGLIEANGGRLVDTVSMGGEIRAFVVNVPRGVVSSFASDVQASGLSRYVEPNMRFQVSAAPDDPSLSEQWGLAKIEADDAWDTTTGDPSVVVAVLDTGVDWDHPDLAANIWFNAGEVVDGVDNDGNGFVDDIRGWDFVDTAAAVATGEDGTGWDNDPIDFHGHGTLCSGIVAAVTDNGVGVAGVCWNCRIMAVRMAYETPAGEGDFDLDNAVQAIYYATENGADIISMSWGIDSTSSLLYDAVAYAYASGVLLVASAGNAASSDPHYPAAYDEVVAVTATDENDDPASFTNFGGWVELAAPGVSILSTMYDDTYYSSTGTSMAAPHVAGVAALVLSAYPGITRDTLRLHLRTQADDLGDLGFDYYYGYGRINARKAVQNEPPQEQKIVYVVNMQCAEMYGNDGDGHYAYENNPDPNPPLDMRCYAISPPSTMSQIMDDSFRNDNKDSFGTPFKMTFFAEMDYLMSQGVFVYGDGSPAGVSGYTGIRDIMLENWGTQIETYGDSVEYHHHFMLYGGVWYPYDNGPDAGYEDHQMDAIDKMILDGNFYPVSWDSGWGIMPLVLSDWLEQWMPFDYTSTSSTSYWYPIHPTDSDGSTSTRWAQRTDIWPSWDGINGAFATARSLGSAVYCYSMHVREDMAGAISSCHDWLVAADSAYPDVSFKYVTAADAMRLALGWTDFTEPTFTLSPSGDSYIITASEALWADHPYVALEYSDGTYTHMEAVNSGSNTWTITPPYPSSLVEIGVAASDLYGNSGVLVLDQT
jgi:subtilisin family serine protease